MINDMNSMDSAMPPDRWLMLTDYSSKYRVSVSTLRRRIRAGMVRHRLENGRYLVPDVHPGECMNELGSARPLWENENIGERRAHARANADDSIAALKASFLSILTERDQQIVHLKAEISDLKTLVSALESEMLRAAKARGPIGAVRL